MKMKSLAVIFSLFGVMSVFGFGFTMNRSLSNDSDIEQIHLSCWDQDGTSNIERVRLVLNKSMHGLVWFSNFAGDPLEDGTLLPHAGAPSSSSVLEVNLLTAKGSVIAQIPSFVFQPHIRSLRMTVEKNSITSGLECRKINLAKRQSSNESSVE